MTHKDPPEPPGSEPPEGNPPVPDKSPDITPEIAAYVRYLVGELGMFQHHAAGKLGINQGRVSEIMRGHRHPHVPPNPTPPSNPQFSFPF